MGVTSVDLYRRGNASGARLDNVRRQDVDIYRQGGVDWVRAGTGGVSTFASCPPVGVAKIWRLPAQTFYPDDLVLMNDHHDHWLWEPAKDMPLADYKAALAAVNGNFQ